MHGFTNVVLQTTGGGALNTDKQLRKKFNVLMLI